MSTTVTKQHPMSFDFAQEDLFAIEQGQLILFHTETLWCIGCDSHNEAATKKLAQLASVENPIELVVNSLEMIHQYTSHLHPRLQTLLTLHRRPLTVLYPPNKSKVHNSLLYDANEVPIRLSLNDRTKNIINHLNRPLACIYATTNTQFPQSFGTINSDIFEQVDYISKYGRNFKEEGSPSVFVKLGEKDELDFIRG